MSLTVQSPPTGAGAPTGPAAPAAAPAAAALTEKAPAASPDAFGGAARRGLAEADLAGKTSCPFLRTALKEGILDFDGKTAPQEKLTEILGGGLNGFGQVAKFFANYSHTTGDQKALKQYDPLNLVGSRGDHPGDSKILEGGQFNPERFEAFTRNSRPGDDGRQYMTVEDFGRSIAADIQADPESRVGRLKNLTKNNPVTGEDIQNSAGEFALLLEGFGAPTRFPDGSTKKAISVDDMRLLFEKNVFPAGWEQRVRSASAAGWAGTTLSIDKAARSEFEGLKTTTKMAEALRTSEGATGSAYAGASASLGDQSRLPPSSVASSLKGARTGVCPAQQGAGMVTNPSDVEATHP